jgi:hypothetical protein
MNIKGIYIIICNLYKTTRKINHETLKDYVNSKINDTNNEMKNYQTIINKLDAKTNYTSAQTIINILTTINSNIFNYQNQLIEQNPHTSELLSIKHQLNHDYHRSIKLINSLFPS